MKYGLLVGKGIAFKNTSDGFKNIGDYIQNVAAMQYLPKVDEYIDRETTDNGKDKIKVIMNGWYIGDPANFPCYERIIPLPVSMHIVPKIAETLLSQKNVYDWFKHNEPIGCRDKETQVILEKYGIHCYFSNCLTLTLGKTYSHNAETKNKQIIFVDPYLSKRSDYSRIQTIKLLRNVFFHPLCFLILLKKFIGKTNVYCTWESNFKARCFNILQFIDIYKKRFSTGQLSRALYLTHIVKVGKNTNLVTEDEKLDYAKELLTKYSNAPLVVSSRIHCILPCIAMKTPTLFTSGKYLEDQATKEDEGRLGGIQDVIGNSFKEINGIKFYDTRNADFSKDFKNLDSLCTKFINKNV